MEYIIGGACTTFIGICGRVVSQYAQQSINMLKSARNMKDIENKKTSGLGYIEGNLTSTQPYLFQCDGITLSIIALKNQIKAAQEERFKFGKAQSVGSTERIISPTHANYFGSWSIDGIGIAPSLRKNFPLNHLHSQFDLRHGGSNINVITSDKGEQYGTTNVDTIGIRKDIYGIVDQTEFTMIGYYDAPSNKFTTASPSQTIIMNKSMQEMLSNGTSEANAISNISTFVLCAGVALCLYGGIKMHQDNKH